MYALAKAYNEEEDPDYELSDDQIKDLEAGSKSFQDGSAKTYSWEETNKAAIESVYPERK